MENKYQERIDSIYKSRDVKNRPISIHPHMEGDPAISVVIPVYQAEKFLRECLDSILRQRLSVSMEVLTVYNESEDASKEILQEYEEKGLIKVFYSDVPGPSRARNIGIENAKGEYLIFVDADDYLIGDRYFEDLFTTIKETDADLVQSGYVKTDGQQILSTSTPLYEEVSGFDRIRETVPGFSWGKIMKAQLFDGISYPVDYWFEDSIFHMIILRRCRKVAFVKTAGYAYRRNPDGITYSKDKSKRSIEAVTVIPKILEMMEEAGEPVDTCTASVVLEHAGLLLENRIRKLSLKEQKTVFLYLAEVIDKLPEVSGDPLALLFKKKKFLAWKLNWFL